MHTSLLHCACILAAATHSVTSSAIYPRRASKIDEFNSTDCTTTYPDGTSDNQPVWHHQPPIDICIGIDSSTVSVLIQTGTGEAAAVGYFIVGMCDGDGLEGAAYTNVTFDKRIDGGSSCHPVDYGNGNRVHDIIFPAEQA